VNLSNLISESVPLVQSSIPGKIELRLELEPGLPPIEADKSQIQQIFMNLALNAAEAIGSDPGLITVKTGVRNEDGCRGVDLAPGRYVYLEVRDTGSGMDQATRARIFDPFFSTKFVGRGLGLAAVDGIVRGHKGAICVETAPGKGSCFTVLFPAAPVGTELAGTGTVLLVDDEEVVRQTATNTLEQYGYRVLSAGSGPAAIDIFQKQPNEIALVILDLTMPGMGGEEVLPELRRIRPDVRVVVSSGYGEQETMPLFTGQQISGFLQKPFTPARLAEKVKNAIAGS
jgi:CheY-like chemotaxis protein